MKLHAKLQVLFSCIPRCATFFVSSSVFDPLYVYLHMQIGIFHLHVQILSVRLLHLYISASFSQGKASSMVAVALAPEPGWEVSQSKSPVLTLNRFAFFILGTQSIPLLCEGS